jgi:GH15 family glucan-1,4-alpha-glucosidase
MPGNIEDYAVIGNCETMALVGRDGSIDWLGLPRFDSPACFAALLGEPQHGRWLIAPRAKTATVKRQYRDSTLILETVFKTRTGRVRVTDFMTGSRHSAGVFRIVTGLEGTVRMRTELVVRFDYGSIVPWVRRLDGDGRLQMTAGPDRLLLDTDVELRGENMRTVGEFDIKARQQKTFALTWSPSFRDVPERPDPVSAFKRVEEVWSSWAKTFVPSSKYGPDVMRSLLVLKALTHWETGGIVAAATTSLPEQLGGERNWDYRYCWLRDATFTLYALIETGYLDEAKAWRSWLARAAAGSPDELQILYGIAGERRIDEFVLPWLPGYQGAKPVRVGNAASEQIQLDVYGEVLDALYVARRAGLTEDETIWPLECALVNHLGQIWDQPDDGIWEVRGGRRHFVHSKVMAWVAFDRIVRSAEEFSLPGPVKHWKEVRDRIHDNVCANGFDAERNSFVQSYGSKALDASLLNIPLVGFLPCSDPRVQGTVAAIEKELMRGGFVMRYDTGENVGDGENVDGLPPGEGAFLACSFWLVDNYALQGRIKEARELFDRLLALRNDVGLLAEEYDIAAKRQVGNFPQALSHLSLINSARNLVDNTGPAHKRAKIAPHRLEKRRATGKAPAECPGRT